MEVGNCRLKINKQGSDIPLHNVTPAEVQVLRKGHEISANGDPIGTVAVVGTIKRSNQIEVNRLRSKYGGLKHKSGDKDVPVVESLFPGANPQLPQTFAELASLKVEEGTLFKPEQYTPAAEGQVVLQTSDIAVGDDEGPEITPIAPVAPKPLTHKK